MSKDTYFSPFTFVSRGKLHKFSRPVVMGILNVTPDSFYDGGRYKSEEEILQRAHTIVDEGADMIDIGVVSSRPGAELLPPEEEAAKLAPIVALVRKEFPEMIISVDTCFSLPAQKAIESGADIINDISGGQFDEEMFSTVARLQVPYILMHTNGTPDVMQQNPHYDNIISEMLIYFSERVNKLHELGVNDIFIDPGFGFAKTLQHNYELMNHMEELHALRLPLFVGISRKSMIYRALGTSPSEALNGTTALNMISLQKGASILRVHDVKECVECVKIWNLIKSNGTEQ